MAAILHARCSLALCLLSGLLAAQTPGSGRDWFVRAGAKGGDGSRTAPFDDPWRALVLCEAGDRIHLTTGQYFGRLGVGTWNIPNERVQLLGGYDPGFTARDPWRRPTQLCWNSTSKNWPLCARLSSDRRDVVVDGLVIDMQDQNNYVTEQRLDRAARLGESAMQFSAPATVRNCVILNPGCRAIDCTVGATIENNLVVNALVWSIAVSGAPAGVDRTTATIRGNTVLFAWDTEKPGAGGYGGSAIAVRGPAVVADNVLGHCDNAAIYAVVDPARLSITGNVFWHNRFANLTAEVKGQRAVVDDREMEMMEDVGLAACAGNRVADPAIAIDAKAFAAGLAPACSLEQVLRMLRPAGAAEPAGARALALAAPQFASAPPAPVRNYQRTALTSWNGKPASVDGKALEMLVAIGPVANVQSMPAEYAKDAKDAIAGVRLFDPEGSGEMVTGFYPTGSAVDRVCADATGWYQGSGKPPRLHLVRGIARAVNGVPKAAFFVEAIERCEPPRAATAAPPPGRDWFVLAGATGGDGSREKPFRDPFQALERCEAGDTIHVATGEYHGKLKAGRWSVGMPFVTLLGGYDATFARRDPWRQPTRLQCAADFQGRRVGYTLEGTDDHTGAVVDGFVFDKRCDNVYDKDGALDVAHSDKIEHVWLSRPGCQVRNCVFLNGASSAMRMAGGQSVCNCVFVNHVVQTVSVEPGHSTDPFEFRDNTVLFVWSNHPGEGHGASGSLLRVGGQAHAVVEHNVFAYADNDAIRIECDPRDVALRANLFAHNLWSNVQHMPTSVDDTVIGQLADLDLGACEGNRVAEPSLPIDQAWLARYLAARPADAPKSAPPPSKPVPAGNPFADGADARELPAATPAAANPFGAPAGAPAGGADGKPFAPAYEWQAAVELAVATGDVGARRRELPVAFTGITRGQESHDYGATTWAVALRTEAWAGLDGKRVQLEGAIQRQDTMFQLDDVRAQDYACYLFSSPDGSGLPLRCYVRRGTKVQRAFEQAKGFATGGPTELHLLRGIARERRQMVVEAVEKTR